MPDPDHTRKAPPRAANEPAAGRQSGDWVPRAEGPDTPGRIGRYHVSALLGEGGFGQVFRGFDPDLKRDVAIKVPLRKALAPDVLERFLREARAAARIHHANVCPIYEVGSDGDLPYLVMRFVPGGTLAGLLAGRKALLPPQHAVAIARKVAMGVAAAHALGVTHRDLKPQNVLWDADNRQVLVTDFGLARIPGEPALTPDRQVMGTFAYMSPEQARGEGDRVGPHSDVYSLGVILYEMLTGRPPFSGTALELLWKVTQETPRPPSDLRPGLDPWLDAVCLRALSKAPEDRFPTARAFADALGDFADAGEATASVELVEPGAPDGSVAAPRGGVPPPTLVGLVTQLPLVSPERGAADVSAREVVICPECGIRLTVSWGRSRPVDCPGCQCRFDVDLGRRSARAVTTATAAGGATASGPAPAPRSGTESTEAQPPVARVTDWDSAIGGVTASFLAGVVWVGFGLAWIVVALFATAEPGPTQVGGFTQLPRSVLPPEASPEVPLVVRGLVLVGLILVGVGRWWAASLPPRMAGAIAARISTLGFWAAAGCIAYTTFATDVRPLRDVFRDPSLTTGYAGFGVGLAGIMLGEIAFTFYLSAIGRRIGSGATRKRIATARRRLVFLLGTLATSFGALTALSGRGQTEAVAVGLAGLACAAGCVSVCLAVAAVYLIGTAQLRVVSEMWNDSLREADE